MLGKLMNTYHVYTVRMSSALNGSSVLERFERGNGIEIRNGIMFDFYPGLPHIYITHQMDTLAPFCDSNKLLVVEAGIVYRVILKLSAKGGEGL